MAKKFKDIIQSTEDRVESGKTAAALLLDAQAIQEKQMNARFALRLDKELYDTFTSINKKMMISNSNVLRAFISEYVKEHKDLLNN